MAEYVSLKEASRRFGYEASTIRRWLKEERIDGANIFFLRVLERQ